MKQRILLLFATLFLGLLLGCHSTYYNPKELPVYPELSDKDFVKAPCYALLPSKLLPDTTPKEFAYDPDRPALGDVLLKEAMNEHGYNVEDFSKCLSFSRLKNVEHVIQLLGIQSAKIPVQDGTQQLVYRMVVMVRAPGNNNDRGNLAVPHARFFQAFHKYDNADDVVLQNPYSQQNLKPLFANLMKNRSFREALQPGGLTSGIPLKSSIKTPEVKLFLPDQQNFISWQKIPDSILPARTENANDQEMSSTLCGRWRCEDFSQNTIQRSTNATTSQALSGMVEYLFRKDGSYSLVQFLQDSNGQPVAIVATEGKWCIHDGWLYLALIKSETDFLVLKILPTISTEKPETMSFSLDVSYFQDQYKKVFDLDATVMQTGKKITLSYPQNATIITQTLTLDSFRRVTNPVQKK